jgi:very-short-patch-repair endonuclease
MILPGTECQVGLPPAIQGHAGGMTDLPLGTAEGGGGGVPQAHRPEVYNARKLRKEMSLPEVQLWQRLRGGKAGLKFRRQHPIGPYIVDFYCRAAALAIEVDGEAHNRSDRPARDERRDTFLKENGVDVLHVAAARILKDPDAAAEAIVAYAARPLHHPSDGPPPRSGEERHAAARARVEQT